MQGRESIFPSLADLTAEQASRSVNGTATVAAHALHILYALRVGNTNFGHPEPPGSWEDSWAVQTVDEEAWQRLQQDLRFEYEHFREGLAAQHSEDPDTLLGTAATVPHMAFHLGAIRQLMRVVTPQ